MRRPLCLLLALALGCAEIGVGIARAQSATADVEPPVIELEALDEATAGTSQVFTAQVVDDRSLRDVRLYHRRAGGRPFESVAMRPVGDSAFHSVTLPTDPDDLRDIEYYVQARDEGGNRSVAGFAFEPFVRALRPAAVAPQARAPETGPAGTRAPGAREPAPSAQAPTAVDPPSIGSKVRWWHVALGVVAVGSLAALAGGGGDGGDDAPGGVPIGPGVPLTINLGEPGR